MKYELRHIRNFKYELHSSFVIPDLLKQKIKEVEGVDKAVILSKYSAVIYVGELFDKQPVIEAVRSIIKDYVCSIDPKSVKERWGFTLLTPCTYFSSGNVGAIKTSLIRQVKGVVSAENNGSLTFAIEKEDDNVRIFNEIAHIIAEEAIARTDNREGDAC